MTDNTEAFEKWYWDEHSALWGLWGKRNKEFVFRFRNNDYCEEDVATSWFAWQAATAQSQARIAELEEMVHDHAKNSASAVSQCIEYQGRIA
jgi:hypothetical protein